MTAEELLKTLRDGGLNDEAITKLLNDALTALNPKNEEDEEKKEAEKLLGVSL